MRESNPMAGAMNLINEMRREHYEGKLRKTGGSAMKPGEFKNEVCNTDDDEVNSIAETQPVAKAAKTVKRRAAEKHKTDNKTVAVRAQTKEDSTMAKKKRVARKRAKPSKFGQQSAYSITIVGAVKLPGYELADGEKLAIVRLTPIKSVV